MCLSSQVIILACSLFHLPLLSCSTLMGHPGNLSNRAARVFFAALPRGFDMRLNFWLANLVHFVTGLGVRVTKRRRPEFFGRQTFAVESLESRCLLSAGAVPVGPQVQVDTYTQNNQENPATAMNMSGDYVTVWTSLGQDGDMGGIYGQRFNASGGRVGSEFRVNTTTTNDQSGVQVAIDAAGDFVVTWNSFFQDGDLFGVYAQRFNSSGVAQGGEFLVNTYTTGSQLGTKIAMDATGDFVITWSGYGPVVGPLGKHGGVYAQRYDASGVAQGGNFKVDPATALGSSPSIAMDQTGDFVITYSSSSGDAAQRYNAAGTAVGSPISITHDGAVAMDSSGDFVVTWHEFHKPTPYETDYGVFAQRYSAAGVAQGNEIVVQSFTTSTERFPAVAMDANGDFVIAWASQASTANIKVQQYDSAGLPQGGQFLANSGGVSGFDATVGMNATNFVVSWDGYSDGNLLGVFSQLYATNFTPAVHGLGETLTYQQKAPAMAVAPDLVVVAPSGQSIVSATVSFTNWQAEDRLSFYNSLALQHTFTEDLTAHTATLTITGAATDANYTTLLRSVVYQDVAGNPITSQPRIATITVSDGPDTASGTQTINVAAVLGGLGQQLTYVQGTDPISVAPNLVITLPGGQNISSATVSFTNWQGEDRLSFSNTLALQHTFTEDLTAHTATLTITGNASASGYQTLLRSVTYQDVAGSPNTSSTRIATISVNAGAYSNSGTQSLKAATVLAGLNETRTYVHGAAPLTVAPNLVVTLPAGDNVVSATVSFTNWQGEDRLAFYNSLALQHTFTEDLTAHTATLTLTGTASDVNYQTLLRSVTYQDVAGKPITSVNRTATITVNDGSRSISGSQTIKVQG